MVIRRKSNPEQFHMSIAYSNCSIYTTDACLPHTYHYLLYSSLYHRLITPLFLDDLEDTALSMKGRIIKPSFLICYVDAMKHARALSEAVIIIFPFMLPTNTTSCLSTCYGTLDCRSVVRDS